MKNLKRPWLDVKGVLYLSSSAISIYSSHCFRLTFKRFCCCREILDTNPFSIFQKSPEQSHWTSDSRHRTIIDNHFRGNYDQGGLFHLWILNDVHRQHILHFHPFKFSCFRSGSIWWAMRWKGIIRSQFKQMICNADPSYGAIPHWLELWQNSSEFLSLFSEWIS